MADCGLNVKWTEFVKRGIPVYSQLSFNAGSRDDSANGASWGQGSKGDLTGAARFCLTVQLPRAPSSVFLISAIVKAGASTGMLLFTSLIKRVCAQHIVHLIAWTEKLHM